MMEFFVDPITGELIGAFSANNPAVPEGAVKVTTPPPNGQSTWDFNNSTWIEYVLPDVEGLMNDIWENATLKPLRMHLATFKGLIKEYYELDPTRIFEAWVEDLYPSMPDYDPQTETSGAGDLVEYLATQRHIALRPQ